MHFCYEVPVSAIPLRYRDRLPRQMQFCSVEAPETNASGVSTTRLWHRAKAKTLGLTADEAETLARAIAHTEAETPPIQVAPSYLLPAKLQKVSAAFVDLLDTDHAAHEVTGASNDPYPPERSLFAQWYLLASEQVRDGKRLVTVSRVRERLEGRAAGRVYAVWIPCDALDQAMDWDRSFEHLDAHEQRVRVNQHALDHGATPPAQHALDHGATPPASQPRATDDTVAVTRDELQEQYQLARFRDPVFLRKEDVLATDSPEDVLEKAAKVVRGQQETLRERMARRLPEVAHEAGQEQQALLCDQHADLLALERLEILHGWLEETEIWFTSLPRRERPAILSLKPVVVDMEEPVLTTAEKLHPAPGKPSGRPIRQVGYLLLISVPTDMPIPKRHVPLVQSLHHPSRTIHSQKKRAA